MANNYKYQMTFDLNHRNEIIIEDVESINKTLNEETDLSQNGNTVFFGEEYKMGLNVIQEFVSVANKRKDKKNVNADLGGYFDSINNIVIFTGERGSGKTSAMLSFGEYLCNNDLKKQDLPNVRFWHLPMIDPSLFDENRNILLTLLSIMLEKAKQIQRNCDKTCVDENDSIYFDLLRQIQKVFEMVGHLNVKPDGKKYDLEYLNELGGVSSLKDEMRALVEKYLKFISPSADFLVLMVDDIDMNTEYAPQMLEQIQKFLMIDNLIILMAANMDQLQNEMTEHYSKSFSYTIKSGERKIAPMDVEDIATKYLLKIFPATSRIHLGNGASKLLQTSVKIVRTDGKIEGGKSVGLQCFILNTIWQKTHLLFVPQNDNQLHPIIPRNLRDLHQFVNLLLDLEEVKRKDDKKDVAMFFQTKKEYDTVFCNFLKFKDYIINTWIPYHLSYDDQVLFEKIPQEITEVNKYLIQIINTVANEYMKKRNIIDAKKGDATNYTFASIKDKNYEIANDVSNLMNIPSNVSMGDLLMIVDKFSIYFEGNDFIEAVKVYYSMLLFEVMFYESPVTITNIDLINEKNELARHKNRIQQLIGGTVYSPHYFRVIKSEYYDDEYMDEDITQNHLYYHQTAPWLNKKEDDNSIFFTLYYGSNRPLRFSKTHIYDTINEESWYRFDLLSLFANIINPKHFLLRYAYKHSSLEKVINSILNERIAPWFKNLSIPEKSSTSVKGIYYFSPFVFPLYSIDLLLLILRIEADLDSCLENENDALKEIALDPFAIFDYDFKQGVDVSAELLVNETNVVDYGKMIRDYGAAIYYSMVSTGSEDYDIRVARNVDYDNVISSYIIPNELNNWRQFCRDNNIIDFKRYKFFVIRFIKRINNKYKSTFVDDDFDEILQKKNTKEEVVEYLIKECLIKNVLSPIRLEQQTKARTPEVVAEYYKRIGNRMDDYLKMLNLNSLQISEIYKAIFNAGVKVFIGDKAQIDYAEEKELGTEDTPASSVSGKE